jgi:hypothetical protein
MSRSFVYYFALALVLASFAGLGCGNKKANDTGQSNVGSPTPGPSAGPGTTTGPGNMPGSSAGSKGTPGGGSPPNPIPYDPNKPDFKIDLTKFSSFIIQETDSTASEWPARHGKVAVVEGRMGHLFADLTTLRERFHISNPSETGVLSCELLNPPDWRQMSPGRFVKITGIVNVRKEGRIISIDLKDVVVLEVSGAPTPELDPEQLGKDYASRPSEFDKKWKAVSKYYYMTATIKRIEKIQLSHGVAYKFIIGAGKVDLYCSIQNERGVNADPPQPGSKVTLLVDCQGYDSAYEKAIIMSGVYVGK